jgi:hypothetical protein
VCSVSNTIAVLSEWISVEDVVARLAGAHRASSTFRRSRSAVSAHSRVDPGFVPVLRALRVPSVIRCHDEGADSLAGFEQSFLGDTLLRGAHGIQAADPVLLLQFADTTTVLAAMDSATKSY